MPSNWLYVDTNFPSFTGKESVNDKIDIIQNYLYVLLENLRYCLRNLDMRNMNQTELKKFTGGLTDPIYKQLQDAAGNITSLQVTAQGLEMRITSAEGDINQLNVTAQGLAAHISSAQGDINQLNITAQGLAAQISNAQGDITQLQATAQGLSARIANAEGDVTQLQAAAQGLSARITNAEGDVTALQATAQGLAARVSNAEGAVSTLQQTVNGFTLSASNGTSSSTLGLYANGVLLSSTDIQITGMVTFNDLSTQSTTKIYGGNIDTSTLRVDNLYGQYVYLNNRTGVPAGCFSITGASSSDFAVDLESYGALRLTADWGDVYIEHKGGSHIQLTYDVVLGGGNTRPNKSTYSCGTAAFPWSDIYSFNSTVQTSDRNKKHDIEPLPEKYLDMLGRIEPRRFKLNDGSSGRYHVGFIAQEVEDAMTAAGVDPLEFGGWVKDKDGDGNDIYMLRYSEFIGVLWGKLRRLEEHIKKLEGSV